MNSGTSKLLILFTLLVMCSVFRPPLASASVTIRNVPPTPHFAPAGTPLEDISAAIQLAADEMGWRIVAEAPGVLQASLRIRSHEAVVSIGFDESNYWINYQDSFNLDYSPNGRRATKTRKAMEGPRIHRNYHVWVDRLSSRIQVHTKAPPKAGQAEKAPSGSPVLIADELEKLDGLRQRGVLSQEEFDRQKAKLLAY